MISIKSDQIYRTQLDRLISWSQAESIFTRQLFQCSATHINFCSALISHECGSDGIQVHILLCLHWTNIFLLTAWWFADTWTLLHTVGAAFHVSLPQMPKCNVNLNSLLEVKIWRQKHSIFKSYLEGRLATAPTTNPTWPCAKQEW